MTTLYAVGEGLYCSLNTADPSAKIVCEQTLNAGSARGWAPEPQPTGNGGGLLLLLLVLVLVAVVVVVVRARRSHRPADDDTGWLLDEDETADEATSW